MKEHMIEIRFIEYVSMLKDSFSRIKPIVSRINESNQLIRDKWIERNENTSSFKKLINADFWLNNYPNAIELASEGIDYTNNVLESVDAFIRTLDSQANIDPNKKVLISIEDYATLCERIYYDNLKPYQLIE